MREVKNAFIKSKMNKDLDSRLVPSGEYRNAINVQVSRSEGSDVGAIENVLGNTILHDFEPTVNNLISIGYFADEFSGDIYVFLTDNTTPDYVPAPDVGSNHFIYKYNASSGIATKLVEGAFLDFSTLNPIYGVNLLETILFWTDNRNQPRRINAVSASVANYYTSEDQISVATYNPYQVIELYEASALSSGDYETTMKDVVSQYLPNGGYANVTPAVTANTDVVITGLAMSMYPNVPIPGMEISTYINQVTTPLGVVDIYIPGTNTIRFVGAVTVADNTALSISPNPYFDPTYNGDPRFLEDKFVRFSYRFNFEDGENSIIAPFTQPCFIPKQDGYFINDSATSGDPEQAYSSTIVDFMENKVNKIGLLIPLPTAANVLGSSLHVTGVDIIYKESDGLALQVVETIPIGTIEALGSATIYNYNYQSRKPYKTLPNSDTIRVYDKVPVKALAQEVISNRIVYGNYQDKHTPPASLNYNISATEKADFSLKTGTGTVNGAVNSTIVQLAGASGTIDVGSIVTGVFTQATAGDVIVTATTSGVTAQITLNIAIDVADTVVLTFSPASSVANTTSKIEYPSSSLKTNRNYQVGIVLSDKFGRQSTTILSNSTTAITVGDISYVGSTLYSPYINTGVNASTWLGNSLKVLFNDPIGTVAPGNNGEPGLYNGDPASGDYNPLGWYSYKVVVKQTEQEYYNVYTAGAMKGSVTTPFTVGQNTSSVILINDNINKVPRDLSEVGPQDKSFRSSVELFGRVENFPETNNNKINKQYYPSVRSFTTSSVESLFSTLDIDSSVIGEDPSIITNAASAFFRAQSNPFLAEVVTSQIATNQFGVLNSTNLGGEFFPIETLAIFETKPVESRLDIFWETSTSGLISDLNSAILNSSGAAGGINGFNTSGFDEGIESGSIPAANISSGDFRLVDNLGANIPAIDVTSFQMLSVYDRQSPPQDASGYFTLTETAVGSRIYNIQVNSNFTDEIYFSQGASTLSEFDFSFRSVVNQVTTDYNEHVVLKNIGPTLTVVQQQGSAVNDTFISSVTTSTIGVMNAVNGAWNTGVNNTGNPNRYKGLLWSIVAGSETNSAGQASTYFSVSSVEDSVNKKSVCTLINTATGTITADTYTLTIQVVDPGGAVAQVVITIELEATLGIAKDGLYSARTDDSQTIEDTYWTYVLLEVTNTQFPGFYVYYDAEYVNNGSPPDAWDELVADSGAGNIEIDRTGPTTTVVGNPCYTPTSTKRRWFYATTLEGAEDAVDKFKACITPQGASQFQDGRIDITNTANYNFAVV